MGIDCLFLQFFRRISVVPVQAIHTSPQDLLDDENVAPSASWQRRQLGLLHGQRVRRGPDKPFFKLIHGKGMELIRLASSSGLARP